MAKYKTTLPKGAKSFFRRVISAKILIILFLLLALIAAITLAFLDFRVRSEFEGKRWALPAKVYARPLELYRGAPLSIADLKIELQALGYQFVDNANTPGQAAFSNAQATIVTRGFNFLMRMSLPENYIYNFLQQCSIS